MIVYSLGRNRWDNRPEQRAANTLREFAADVLGRRARDKASAGYVCAGFGNDGHRRAANVLPRPFVALDVDGIDASALPDYRMRLMGWQGFGWPTASSTPEAPRERVIVMLSEPLPRDECMRVGKLIVQDIEDEFGAAVRIDPCTLRGEQPCFLALQGAQPFFLLGEPLDVREWLAQAPALPAPPPPATADAIEMADARMRWIVGVLGDAGLLVKPLDNGRGYAMACPWQREHTTADPPGSTATALLFPAEANGWRGGFACLHGHCRHRRLTDLVEVLRRAARLTEEAAA
jgi:hypothetical protein